MDTLARPIVALYGLSNGILATSVKDLSDQDAKTRIRAGAGPSVAWAVGHLCHYKVKALALLGQTRDNPFSALFNNAPASDGTNYPTLSELMASFSALNADLCGALASSAARLESPMPDAGPHDEKKVFDTILFMAWHEAYHVGSIGAIRKELGRKAISELVLGR
jgi:uncharacterized damage-inducible protein DinB